MVFWCQLLQNCPVPELNPLPGSSPTTTVASNTTLESLSHFSNVLLYFKHSDRYLCIDDAGRVYSRKRVPVSVIFITFLKVKD